MRALFKIDNIGNNNIELELVRHFLHIHSTIGLISIAWNKDSGFRPQSLGDCIKSISRKDNGTWVSNWENGTSVALEFGEPEEDQVNLCVNCGQVSFWIVMKESLLSSLCQWLIDNDNIVNN